MAKNKMTKCKSCGNEISSKGKVTCPSCGRVHNVERRIATNINVKLIYPGNSLEQHIGA